MKEHLFGHVSNAAISQTIVKLKKEIKLRQKGLYFLKINKRASRASTAVNKRMRLEQKSLEYRKKSKEIILRKNLNLHERKSSLVFKRDKRELNKSAKILVTGVLETKEKTCEGLMNIIKVIYAMKYFEQINKIKKVISPYNTNSSIAISIKCTKRTL